MCAATCVYVYVYMPTIHLKVHKPCLRLYLAESMGMSTCHDTVEYLWVKLIHPSC